MLLYSIEPFDKYEPKEWLEERADDLLDISDDFLSFYEKSGRNVFLRISAIQRIILCWDVASEVQRILEPPDNLNIPEEEKKESTDIPLIIKIHARDEPLES